MTRRNKKRKRRSKPRKRRGRNKLSSKFRVSLRKRTHKTTHALTYWMTLVVLLVSNFVVSIVSIPFLIVLEPTTLYLLIIVFGLIFGSLLKLTLSSIPQLERKHHLFAILFIPIIALINIAVITVLTNKMIQLLQLTTHWNPLVLGFVYGLAFASPTIYDKCLEMLKR